MKNITGVLHNWLLKYLSLTFKLIFQLYVRLGEEIIVKLQLVEMLMSCMDAVVLKHSSYCPSSLQQTLEPCDLWFSGCNLQGGSFH